MLEFNFRQLLVFRKFENCCVYAIPHTRFCCHFINFRGILSNPQFDCIHFFLSDVRRKANKREEQEKSVMKLDTFTGSLELIKQLAQDDKDVIQVTFNSMAFSLRRATFTRTSCLIAELLPTHEIEINLLNVNCNTFKEALNFFNSGFVSDEIHKNICLIELLLLADYMQAPILYEFCHSRFLQSWAKTIPKKIFHHTVIPFNIFSSFTKVLESEGGNEALLQLWTQYTCKTKLYESHVFIANDETCKLLSKIDLNQCSFASIKAAQAKMPEHLFQQLSCSGLIKKLSQLCAASVLSARSEGGFHMIRQSSWNEVFGLRQPIMMPL